MILSLCNLQLDRRSIISYNYDMAKVSMVPTSTNEVRLGLDEARLVGMLKALGNPIRFQIMQTLAERQTCITQEIVETTPLAQSTVSQHLKVLREAGLIQGEIEGPATCYCINPVGVRWLKEQVERWLPACCEPREQLVLSGPEKANDEGCSCRRRTS
jgi:ArsR family transcriptional regulator, arsenate/arsenite/antimonite-responsive transcriptional repressor